ncbi:SRPBCC domain-containing protein [Paenibacillus sp. MER TA 81-3]|uniref:SRPBCC family protein n=1 Tax=Paenibacillus sp. MER TA 81-3 TaxID=2939573 RepID=UPI00203F562D|nr:SRPBCC domain-containing protein [Paenibacillus sp. MER TA 81-3]MCM3340492.1 SRPBCC domain-containing protein [Paenibacillus sp. MER TA 81-3]
MGDADYKRRLYSTAADLVWKAWTESERITAWLAPAAEIEPKREMVDVELEPASNGTMVTLKHAGWQDSEEWLAAIEWHIQAWEQMLASLKSNMESDNGVLCCK